MLEIYKTQVLPKAKNLGFEPNDFILVCQDRQTQKLRVARSQDRDQLLRKVRWGKESCCCVQFEPTQIHVEILDSNSNSDSDSDSGKKQEPVTTTQLSPHCVCYGKRDVPKLGEVCCHVTHFTHPYPITFTDDLFEAVVKWACKHMKELYQMGFQLKYHDLVVNLRRLEVVGYVDMRASNEGLDENERRYCL